MENRTIAILHRIKRTVAGESRPTLLRIANPNGNILDLELATEQDELDFILGRYPLRMRSALASDKITDYPEHLIVLEEDIREKLDIPAPEHHKVVKGKKTFVLRKVPDVSIGLQKEDVVLMPLGGSGDYLAFAMSVQAEKIGAKVFRIPPRLIKVERDELSVSKSGIQLTDLEIIGGLFERAPEYFYPVSVRERDMIEARKFFRARESVQRERKPCAQRIRQLGIGETFIRADGLFPQGSIEKEFDKLQANDDILGLITKREKRLEADLAKAMEQLPVYTEVFQPIEGVGPVIAAGIVCAVGNIHLFVRSGGNLRYRAGKLKKYCGVAPEDGHLPRKTAGKSLGFNPQVRQALFKFGDQLVKRPGSVWGQRLAENKTAYQAKYPFPTLGVKEGDYKGEYILDSQALIGHARKKGVGGYEIFIVGSNHLGQWVKVAGKQKNFKGHLHKKAIWKTLTQFVEHLYDEWTKLEGIGDGEAEDKAAA